MAVWQGRLLEWRWWAQRLSLSVSLALVLLILGVSPALATDRCTLLHKKGKAGEAARCLEREAQAMENGPVLSRIQRRLKGWRLRNAAKLYRLAAKKTASQAEGSFLRERALLLLRGYLKERLCSRAARCRAVQASATGLEREIGYARLAVKTGAVGKVRLTVNGHKLRLVHTGSNWSLRLRPGRYQVEAVWAGGRTTTRTAELSRGQKLTIRLFPPIPKPRVVGTTPGSRAVTGPVAPRPPRRTRSGLLPWIVGGAGLALVAGGAVALGVGKARASARDEAYEEMRQKTAAASVAERQRLARDELPEIEARAKSHHEAAGVQLAVGWVMMGSGVAALGTATVLYALLKSRRAGGITVGRGSATAVLRLTPGGVVVQGRF